MATQAHCMDKYLKILATTHEASDLFAHFIDRKCSHESNNEEHEMLFDYFPETCFQDVHAILENHLFQWKNPYVLLFVLASDRPFEAAFSRATIMHAEKYPTSFSRYSIYESNFISFIFNDSDVYASKRNEIIMKNGIATIQMRNDSCLYDDDAPELDSSLQCA